MFDADAEPSTEPSTEPPIGTPADAGSWPDPAFETVLRRHLPFLAPGEEITPELPLRDHGLDSLGTVTLLVELEDAYAVRFRDEALTPRTFRTAGTLWKVLREIA
ncbi:phosphopantetheine-binding protein [Actinomadura roseirufa]|uniref:phosphopantetheine-binding protein n=1 Tax=Actinomadura roseirufa TaxID=2094049 RepID=UPI001041B149|nr:phosphopantetheine-binding protein [Actinomadura roseirufa]